MNTVLETYTRNPQTFFAHSRKMSGHGFMKPLFDFDQNSLVWVEIEEVTTKSCPEIFYHLQKKTFDDFSYERE